MKRSFWGFILSHGQNTDRLGFATHRRVALWWRHLVTRSKSDWFYWWMCRRFNVSVHSLIDKSRLCRFLTSLLYYHFPPNYAKLLVFVHPSFQFESKIIVIFSVTLAKIAFVQKSKCMQIHTKCYIFASIYFSDTRPSFNISVAHAASITQSQIDIVFLLFISLQLC